MNKARRDADDEDTLATDWDDDSPAMNQDAREWAQADDIHDARGDLW